MISVVIPTYQMQGGVEFLKRSLEAIKRQTYKDVEVIISDNSDNDDIENLIQDYDCLYFRNPIKGMAENTNNAIDKASGDLIKILFQDDFLAHNEALENIVNNFQGAWLVTGCNHLEADPMSGLGYVGNEHYAEWNDQIYIRNTIGSPSVLTISKEVMLRFNPYKYVLDADFYKRIYDQLGEPTILNDINVTIGLGKHQQTNLLSQEEKENEHKQLYAKYTSS